MKLPRLIKIRQRFTGPAVEDIDEMIALQFDKINLGESITAGKRIAITVGSRGIANIHIIIRATVNELKKRGAEPFIIPAMGSHGGATAEGQVEVLHSLGITEAYCGAPIVSSMEVVQMGETSEGMPVYVDRHAWEADGIVLMGRIKAHTDFKSQFESGLMKMAAIGLGKHKQALQIHSYGVQGLKDSMPRVAKIILEKANILFGVAIIENALEQTARIEVIPTELIPEREVELLAESMRLMPKLPVEKLDLLIVDEIGKNYSGTGMDTNMIGRIRINEVEEPKTPRIKYVLACDLSEESHGNALGIGLADLTTKKLFNKIDFHKMNENVITSTFIHRASIPIVLENDLEAIQVALRVNWGVEPEKARIIRIPNTLHLEYLFASEALLPELEALSNIEILGEAEKIAFTKDGFIPKWQH